MLHVGNYSYQQQSRESQPYKVAHDHCMMEWKVATILMPMATFRHPNWLLQASKECRLCSWYVPWEFHRKPLGHTFKRQAEKPWGWICQIYSNLFIRHRQNYDLQDDLMRLQTKFTHEILWTFGRQKSTGFLLKSTISRWFKRSLLTLHFPVRTNCPTAYCLEPLAWPGQWQLMRPWSESRNALVKNLDTRL